MVIAASNGNGHIDQSWCSISISDSEEEAPPNPPCAMLMRFGTKVTLCPRAPYTNHTAPPNSAHTGAQNVISDTDRYTHTHEDMQTHVHRHAQTDARTDRRTRASRGARRQTRTQTDTYTHTLRHAYSAERPLCT